MEGFVHQVLKIIMFQSLPSDEPNLRIFEDPVKVQENGSLQLNIDSNWINVQAPNRLSWFYNGEEQVNDSRRYVTYPYMFISRVQRSDAGRYSFSVASIVAGTVQTDETSFFLDVLCKLKGIFKRIGSELTIV